MSDTETRGLSGIEIRQGHGGRPRLVGYAAVWDARSVGLRDFVETIRRGAFTRSLRENPDLRAFIDHDPGRIIGRVSARTLIVEEDAHGMRVEISPPDTSDGRDVIENVRVGNLDGMSFAMKVDRTHGQRWDFKQAPPFREILEAAIPEVSIVSMPAYPDTEIALRSLAAHRETMPTLDRLREKLANQRAAWR